MFKATWALRWILEWVYSLTITLGSMLRFTTSRKKKLISDCDIKNTTVDSVYIPTKTWPTIITEMHQEKLSNLGCSFECRKWKNCIFVIWVRWLITFYVHKHLFFLSKIIFRSGYKMSNWNRCYFGSFSIFRKSYKLCM